jgi:hypothetical protein
MSLLATRRFLLKSPGEKLNTATALPLALASSLPSGL